MIYFYPIRSLTLPNASIIYDTDAIEKAKTLLLGTLPQQLWRSSSETYLEKMKRLLNTRGNKDIFVFVSAFNQDPDEGERQTPHLLRILEENDLTKHIHLDMRGLTNGQYEPGNIDLFILTRKTRTSHTRIISEKLDA